MKVRMLGSPIRRNYQDSVTRSRAKARDSSVCAFTAPWRSAFRE